MTTRSIDEVAAIVQDKNLRKRAKTVHGEYKFLISFPSSETLEALVTTLKHMLNDVTFEVVKTAKFQGIRTDMLHGNHVCVFKSMLSALVKFPDEKTEKATFTVNTESLKNIFNTLNGNPSVDILMLKGEDELRVCSYGSPYESFVLRTLVTRKVPDRLLDMETEYSLFLTSEELKRFCSSVSRFGADDLQLELRSRMDDGPDDMKTTYTILKCATDANSYSSIYKQKTPVTTDANSKTKMQFVCNPLTDCEVTPNEIEKAKILYSAKFRVAHIQNFLVKAKGRVYVALNQQEDGSPGPIIFHVGLGDESSYMRLVQAPQIDDDDE